MSRTRTSCTLPIVAALLLWTGVALGQTPGGGEPDARDAMRIEVLRTQSGSPSIDGRLDDPIWSQARWVTDFTQKEPDQGLPATLGTEVAFAYDDHALYVGARMHTDDPAKIGNYMTRRDDGGQAERLIVSLDTFLDRRTAYSFVVTAAGVRVDYFHPSDSEFDRDFTFEPVWTARTNVTPEGWTAEMRIPFSQLRFNDGDDLVWGVNINRYVPAINEDSFWIVVPRDEAGWASRFGDLVGLRDIPSTKRIEIIPYVASAATRTSEGLLEAGDPFEDGSEMEARTGLDFRMGLGPNLTLDAAINPDFGQVEADPAEVNLSAFETFFEERRPFFTAGQQNFEGNGSPFYYSRRIGAPPHLATDDLDTEADFFNEQSTTTILGAAKLTGRLQSGLTVGALAAVTDDETADTFNSETGEFGSARVEPTTTYGVLRLEQQLGENASTLGVTMTAMSRSMDENGQLAEILPRRAIAGGVDWNKRFTDGWYEILGHVGFSHIAGEAAAITDIQERSTRYFQRPDQSHVEVDPDAESLNGWSAAIRGGKRTGNWRWNHGVWLDSPGFEINDVGQLGRADDIFNWFNLRYRETDPGEHFRNWMVGVFTNNGWNFGGVHKQSDVGVFTETTFLNFMQLFAEHGRFFEIQNDTRTRGGPLMQDPAGWWLTGRLSSNFNSANRWSVRWFGSRNDLGGWHYEIEPEFRYQPSDRLVLSAEPRYSRNRVPRQFLDSFDDGPSTTFGQRYVFGLIDRSEIAAALRANYSFSPDLNLELYAEPFASSGRYSGIGELEAAQTSDLRVYGVEDGTTISRDEDGDYVFGVDGETLELENPDFNVLSFRSNMVLRWEWSPGSTLFVVWQQNREEDNTRGRLVRPGNLLDSITAEGDNVLAVKFTYWLPL